MMRALGYPQLISMENFTTPNFELVAHALYWLVKRYDPDIDISDNIEEEDDRIDFIKQVCHIFASKARLKLNIKRIYEARNFAVREMLKIAEMLYKAMKAASMEEEDSSSILDFSLSSKLHNLKSARELSLQITESGAKLYDMVGKERDLREPRQKALEFLESISRNLDSNSEQQYIEKSIRELIISQEGTVDQMASMVENLRANRQSLTQKISRREVELENADKRLKGLAQVRPQYMDEYERLEEELQYMYGLYVDKFRNLDYLESELDFYTKKEEKHLETHIRKVIKFGEGQEEGYGDQDDEKIAGGELLHNERMASTGMKFSQQGGLEHQEEGSSEEDVSGIEEGGLDSDEEEGEEEEEEDSEDENLHQF